MTDTGAATTAAQLYIHSWNYRFRLRHQPGFSFFDVIDDARARGFDGINVSVYGPAFEHLSGGTVSHLRAVRAALDEAGLGVDIENNGTDPGHLRELLEIGSRLGAGLLRTFTTTPEDDERARISKAIKDLRQASVTAEQFGITIVVENHEDLDGDQVAEIVSEVDSAWVKVLFDFGNSVFRGQHPLDALDRLLPWVVTAHLKDQVFLADHQGAGPHTLGVPVGAGGLPVRLLIQRLLDAGVRRICFENTWAYLAPLLKPIRADTRRDDAFSPTVLPEGDARFFLDEVSLERDDPVLLARLEAKMMDLGSAGLARLLAGMPITVPRTLGS